MNTVYKFGGSILKDANDIRIVCKKIIQDNNPINVFSAINSITDALLHAVELASSGNKYHDKLLNIKQTHIKICNELKLDALFLDEIFQDLSGKLNHISQDKKISPKDKDCIVAHGEIICCKIIFEYLKKHTEKATFIDTRNYVKTNSDFGSAKVLVKETKKNLLTINNKNINIITGFIGSDNQGSTTTIGRNGSDYSAALIANVLNSDKIILWKDVEGIFTANPKSVKNTHLITSISYQEMHEFSYFGNKAISLMALKPAVKNKIPVIIKGINNIKLETIISDNNSSKFHIKGITKLDNIISVQIQESDQIHKDFLQTLKDFNIKFMSKISSENKFEHTLFFHQSYKLDIQRIIQNFKNINIYEDFSVVSIIGSNIKKEKKYLLNKLLTYGINLNQIIFRARSLCVLINSNKASSILQSLHDDIVIDIK